MMKTRTIQLMAALTGLGLALAAQAQLKDEHQRADIESPEQYEVILENDQVLVLKMVLEPGEADITHRHNDETVYFEKGGVLTITENGVATKLEIPDGFVMWHPAWAHQVTNSGDTQVTAFIVEQKK